MNPAAQTLVCFSGILPVSRDATGGSFRKGRKGLEDNQEMIVGYQSVDSDPLYVEHHFTENCYGE